MNEGKKDRRDPIRTIKTKNPVAKAHQTVGTGSGAHKDKKKAMKQGEVKHKNAEFAESYEQHLQNKLDEATVNPQFINVQVTKILAGEARRMTNAPMAQLLAPVMKEYGLTLQQIDAMVPGGLKKLSSGFGISEAGVDPNAKFDYNAWSKSGKTTTPKHFGPKGAGTKLAQQTRDAAKKKEQGVREYQDRMAGVGMMPSEEVDQGEYSDEVGMVKNNLHTIARMCLEIMKTMKEGENLPEWFEEKISQAKGMIVSAGDYLISQHDQGDIDVEGYRFNNTPKTQDKNTKNTFTKQVSHNGLPEGQSALDQYRKRSAQSDADFAKREAERKKNPGAALGDRIKELEKRYPKEGWTHDSLADELFEHERTYEEQLQSKLNKAIGR